MCFEVFIPAPIVQACFGCFLLHGFAALLLSVLVKLRDGHVGVDCLHRVAVATQIAFYV